MILTSCRPDIPAPENPTESVDPFFCGIGGVDNVNVYHRDDRIFLYGADDPSTHFDVTNFSLEFTQLKEYGYDRETFKALIRPEYLDIQEVSSIYDLDEQVILLKTKSGVKVFPFTLMTYHEVINEEVNGQPVMIAYCFLADLAAVYSRDFCEKTLTFAVSGYTYSDPQIWDGKDGFVLWDRDTESLWWPLIGRAVSGGMKKAMLESYDQQQWEISTMGEVVSLYPSALVLRHNQDWTPPVDFPRISESDLPCK